MDKQLTMQPAFDRLFVKRDETVEKTAGGLYIPESDKEKPNKGIVLAVGPECKFAWVGQEIIFGKYNGQEIELDGEQITILRENDIYAGGERAPVTDQEIEAYFLKHNEHYSKK